MKIPAFLTLSAALGLAAGVAAPALAQKNKAPAPAAAPTPTRNFDISKEARKVLQPLEAAAKARDQAAFAAALPAAQAAARSADEKYIIARRQFEMASHFQDTPGQTAALAAMVASGAATPEENLFYYQKSAEAAFAAKRYDEAAALFERAATAKPSDASILTNISIVRSQQGRPADALTALNRAIALKQASGEPVPEDWRKRSIELAFNAKNKPLALKSNYDWLAGAPTANNWRDALLNFQSLQPLDSAAELDRLRLMRAAGALHGDRSYAQFARLASAYKEYADTALRGGLPGEAQAVLEEGIAKNIVDRNRPEIKELLRDATTRAATDRSTLSGQEARAAAGGRPALGLADAYFGYKDYAKAATFYRTALAKGGLDANLINTRLGLALAMAGDKAGAAAAFNTVTGTRADLARYYLLWLNRRA